MAWCNEKACAVNESRAQKTQGKHIYSVTLTKALVNVRASGGWWTEHSTKSHPANLPSGEDPLGTPGVNSVVSKAII